MLIIQGAWFDVYEQVGGGIQYELPNNIKKLKELDYIKEIK